MDITFLKRVPGHPDLNVINSKQNVTCEVICIYGNKTNKHNKVKN